MGIAGSYGSFIFSQINFSFFRGCNDHSFSNSGVNVPISFQLLFLFPNEIQMRLPYRNNPQIQRFKDMRAVLIICQWEEDKLKNLIPGVSDIRFWFS